MLGCAVVGVVFTVGGAWWAHRQEREARWAAFDALARTETGALSHSLRLSQMRLAVLANFIANSERIEAEEFRRFTEPLCRGGLLRSLAWVPEVPRAEVSRVEGRMRAVEKAIKDVEDAEWRRSNPETKARVQGATSQLENVISALEQELADAQASGDARKVKEAREALEARRSWLEQLQRSSD